MKKKLIRFKNNLKKAKLKVTLAVTTAVALLIGVCIMPTLSASLTKITSSTLLDSDYSWSFKFIDGTTTVTSSGMTNYAVDAIFTGTLDSDNFDEYLSARLTSNSQKGNIWVRYNNVGTYNGQVVDLKITLTDWDYLQPANTSASSTIGGVNYPTVIFSTEAIEVFISSRPAVASPQFTYTFYVHGTDTEISINGHFTFQDMDGASRSGWYSNEYFIPVSGLTAYYVTSDSYMSVSGSKVIDNEVTGEIAQTDKNAWVTAFWSGSSFSFHYGTLRTDYGNSTNDITTTASSTSRTEYHFLTSSESVAPFEFTDVTKSVSSTSITGGDTITYTITQNIPGESSDYYYTSWSLTDAVPSCLAVQSVKVTDDSTTRTSWFNVSTSNNTVTVTAKSSTLTNSLFYNNNINVVITAKLTDGCDLSSYYSSGKSTIPNTASVTISGPTVSSTRTSTIKSNTVNVSAYYKVTTSSSNSSITSTSTVVAGANKTITWSPNSGYYINSITIDGTTYKYSSGSTISVGGTSYSITGSSSYSFNNVATNHTISVSATSMYSITTSMTHGTITASKSNIMPDTDETITFTPNPGYYISSITIDGTAYTSFDKTGDSYTFEDIMANHTIVVETSPYYFTLKGNKIDSETYNEAQGDATLGGAVIAVYYHQGYYTDSSEEPYSENEVVCWATTNDDGSFECDEQLRAGYYEIKEVTAPEGYELNTNSYYFTQTDDSTVEYNLSDEVQKYTFYLKKVMTDGTTGVITQEAGAEFEVYLTSTGEYVDTIVTDVNGEATITVPYGTYTIKQTVGTANYYLTDEFDVILKVEDQHITLNNGAKTAKIKIQKTDADTGESVPISEITFKIWSVENDDWVCQAITYPTTTTLCEFETDANGIMTTPYELDSGNYIIYEADQAIDGYLWNDEGVSVYIGDGMAAFLDETYGNILTVNFENTPVKGTIEVTKYGQQIVYNNTNYSYTYKLTGGIKIGVYAREDIISAAGTLMYSAGDLVTVLTTDANGYASASDLYLGKYYLKEIRTQDYYILDETEYDFELIYEDQYTAVVYADQTLYNDFKEGTLTFTKIDTDTEELLEDVTIAIYRKQSNGSYLQIYETTTDELGQFVATLPYGSYYLEETSTIEGYVLTTEKIYFEITTGNFATTMKNEKIKGSLVFTKTGNSGEYLADVVLGVYDSNNDLVATLTTNVNGEATLEDIVYGTYTIKEISTVEGYVLNEEVLIFSITTDGEVITKSLVNNKITGNIEITTVDSETYETQDGNKVCLYTEDDTLVECNVTTDGKVTFESVEYGSYYVVEEEVIEGYLINENIFTLIITTDGETLTETIPNDPIKGNIAVTVIDKDTEELLANAEVCLYNSNGEELYCMTTDETGYVVFEEVYYGIYTITETIIPEGYNPVEEATYDISVINNAETLEYKYEHQKITGSMLFVKTDSITSDVIEGVNIEVYAANDELIGTYQTDANGEVLIENLEYGSYYIVETATLENYELYTEKTYFVIEEQAKIVTVDLTNDPYSTIDFYNKDKDDGTLLPNGEICIYTIDGTAITCLTFDENGYTNIQLPIGEYYYVQTIAPEGYELDTEKYEFSVVANAKTYEIDVLNAYIVIEVPNTNISNLELYIIGGAIAVGIELIIASFILKKKNNDKNSDDTNEDNSDNNSDNDIEYLDEIEFLGEEGKD